MGASVPYTVVGFWNVIPVFSEIGEAVAVGIQLSVGVIVGIQPVLLLPLVGHAVPVCVETRTGCGETYEREYGQTHQDRYHNGGKIRSGRLLPAPSLRGAVQFIDVYLRDVHFVHTIAGSPFVDLFLFFFIVTPRLICFLDAVFRSSVPFGANMFFIDLIQINIFFGIIVRFSIIFGFIDCCFRNFYIFKVRPILHRFSQFQRLIFNGLIC